MSEALVHIDGFKKWISGTKPSSGTLAREKPMLGTLHHREAARTMPHTLRSILVAAEQLAELTMLCGFDDDLARQATATSNRIRGLLTQIHPALERVLGPRLDHPAVLDVLANTASCVAGPGPQES